MADRPRQEDIEGRLARLARAPRPPAGLEGRLYEELARLERARARRRLRRVRAAAALGSLAAAGLLALAALLPPASVRAAAAHLEREQALAGALDRGEAERWLAHAPLPPGTALLLGKDCLVRGLWVKHLRLRLPDGRVVEALLDRSGRWRGLDGRAGTARGLGWRAAARGRVTALVFGAADAPGLGPLARALLTAAGPGPASHHDDTAGGGSTT